MSDNGWAHAVRRLWANLGVIRPAEWIVIAFVVYMTRFDHTGMQVAPGAPRMTLAAVLGATLVRQSVALSAVWGAAALATYRRVAMPMAAALIALIVLLAGLHFDGGSTGIGVLSGALYSVDSFVGSVLLPTLPIGVAVVGVGVHLGQTGQMEPAAMIRGALHEGGHTLRQWAPPALMLFMYGLMSAALGNIDSPDKDAQLRAVDRWLCLGHDPIFALQRIISRPASEWMAFCYMAYVLIYALGFGAIFAFCRSEVFDELALAITACLALGFVGYTLIPARGPMFAQSFPVDLGAYYLQGIKEQLMDRFRAPRDCFPSLHTAIPLIFTGCAWRYLRPLFWILAPVVAFIPLSCLYLRYHYLSDVLAGILLAAICSGLAHLVARRREVRDAYRSRFDPSPP